MIVYHHEINVTLDANFHAFDLTGSVEEALSLSRVKEGVITIFSRGSTSAVTTIEFETGCLKDLSHFLEMHAPRSGHYEHNARWGDGNGFSHLRSAILGPSLSVPVKAGRPLFSTWQQPILLNLDNRRRDREVMITVTGVD